MANGRPGDHPVSDLFIHGMPAFSPAVDGLLLEIRGLAGPQHVYGLDVDWFRPPPLVALEIRLREERDRLRRASGGPAREPEAR